MAAGTIPVTFAMFMTLGFGWIFMLILGVLTLGIFYFTPAWVFLKASIFRKAVVFLKQKSGLGRFVVGNMSSYGTIFIKGYGGIIQTEESKTFDRKSKVPFFTAFSEFAATLPNHYEPILNEMKKAGFKIKDFRDYSNLIRLSNDKKYADEWIEKLDEDKVAEGKAIIAKLKSLKIQIKPLATYGVSELSKMFPYNYSPVYIDSLITEEVNKQIKRYGLQSQRWIMIGIAVMVMFIGAAIAWKMVQNGQNPTPTVVRVVETGVQTIAANTSLVV